MRGYGSQGAAVEMQEQSSRGVAEEQRRSSGGVLAAGREQDGYLRETSIRPWNGKHGGVGQLRRAVSPPNCD